MLPLTNRDFANGGDGAQAKAARSDLGWGGINAQSADPVDYLRRLYVYLPEAERGEVDRIAKLQSPARERAAVAFVRKIERKALYAVFSHTAVPELRSRRLGCVVHQPQYPGVDLAALCLKNTD